MISRRALIGGALAFAGLASAARAAPLDTVMAGGVLRMAVYKDFEPWSWRREGKLVGIDVDLAALLAERLGLRVDYLELMADETVDDDLRNAVWKGSLLGQLPADVMLHVPYDREFALRNDRAVIVAPYYREEFVLACDGSVDCEVPPPHLRGQPIAAELDSIPDFYLSGAFAGILRGDVRHYPTGSAAVRALVDGEAKVALATRAQVEHGLASKAEAFDTRDGPLPAMLSTGWDIALAVKDNSRDLGDRLEALLRELTAANALAPIFERYGVRYRAPAAA